MIVYPQMAISGVRAGYDLANLGPSGYAGQNAWLHIPVSHYFGGCAKKTYARKFHLKVWSDTKEILTFPKADLS